MGNGLFGAQGGTSGGNYTGPGDLSIFIRCRQPRTKQEDQKLFCWKLINLGESPAHSGPLLSPTLVGDEIACKTPAARIQLFSIRSHCWINNPPPLEAAISMAISLNRNLVVQTKDSIQIFSIGVMTSREAHNDKQPSHIYPLGEKHIVCLLQPNRHLTILESETLQELPPYDNPSPLRSWFTNQPASVHASLSCGLVAKFGVTAIMKAWQSGASLPEWTDVDEKDAPLSGSSPDCTWITTVYKSPHPEIHVKCVEGGKTLAELPLEDDELGAGGIYGLAFDSETRFHLNIDAPGWHVQIPHDIIALPSGHYSHTTIRGEPVSLSEPRATPPYTLDANYEWVIDAQSRKICWISPGNVRRGNGGHFWAGLSLVMVGDDGVVRKVTFREPDR